MYSFYKLQKLDLNFPKIEHNSNNSFPVFELPTKGQTPEQTKWKINNIMFIDEYEGGLYYCTRKFNKRFLFLKLRTTYYYIHNKIKKRKYYYIIIY